MDTQNQSQHSEYKNFELSKEEVIQKVVQSKGDNWLYFDDDNIVFKLDLLIKIEGDSLLYGRNQCLKFSIEKRFKGNTVDLNLNAENINFSAILNNVQIIKEDDDNDSNNITNFVDIRPPVTA